MHKGGCQSYNGQRCVQLLRWRFKISLTGLVNSRLDRWRYTRGDASVADSFLLRSTTVRRQMIDRCYNSKLYRKRGNAAVFTAVCRSMSSTDFSFIPDRFIRDLLKMTECFIGGYVFAPIAHLATEIYSDAFKGLKHLKTYT